MAGIESIYNNAALRYDILQGLSERTKIDPALMKAITVTGRNEAVSTSLETVSNASVPYPWQLANLQFTAKSSSADDTVGGSGAEYLLLDYADEDFNVYQQTPAQKIALNGITPVPLGSFTTLHLAMCMANNRLRSNAGTITIRDSNNVVHGVIPPGAGCTMNCIYTIPPGHEGAVIGYSVGMSTTKPMTVALFTNEPGMCWMERSSFITFDGSLRLPADSDLILPEKTLIDMRVKVGTTDPASSVSAVMTIVYWPKQSTR